MEGGELEDFSGLEETTGAKVSCCFAFPFPLTVLEAASLKLTWVVGRDCLPFLDAAAFVAIFPAVS